MDIQVALNRLPLVSKSNKDISILGKYCQRIYLAMLVSSPTWNYTHPNSCARI